MKDIRDIIGYQDASPEEKRKAEVFFVNARSKAGAAQYDYAIEMFCSGLVLDPDNVKAHQELRDTALRRKASGGKSLGMFAARGLRAPTKDDKTNMVNAEKVLAFDPGNVDAMISLAQSAVKGGFYQTVLWIGPIVLRANADSSKPEIGKFLQLKDVYKSVQQWKLAADAVAAALQLKPGDMDLSTELKHLAAQQTMAEANYSGGGSFRDNVKDADTQQRLMDQDRDIRNVDAMSRILDAARKELAATPEEPGKIRKLAELLVKSGDADLENEAVELLDKAYKRTQQFSFRLSVGKIKMDQLKRIERTLRAEVAAAPNDQKVRKDYDDFRRDQLTEELTEYRLASDNYPSDVGLRYEMAKRLFELKQYDESIPLFQQSVQDPKLRVDASISLGRAFLEAEFPDEAVDTFKALAESYPMQGDLKAKEIFYWFGRSLEQKGDVPDAIKCFSKVAQWDFNYRDVQARIKKLRAPKPNTV